MSSLAINDSVADLADYALLTPAAVATKTAAAEWSLKGTVNRRWGADAEAVTKFPEVGDSLTRSSFSFELKDFDVQDAIDGLANQDFTEDCSWEFAFALSGGAGAAARFGAGLSLRFEVSDTSNAFNPPFWEQTMGILSFTHTAANGMNYQILDVSVSLSEVSDIYGVWKMEFWANEMQQHDVSDDGRLVDVAYKITLDGVQVVASDGSTLIPQNFSQMFLGTPSDSIVGVDPLTRWCEFPCINISSSSTFNSSTAGAARLSPVTVSVNGDESCLP